MAQLKDKIKTALDESRLLILGAQALLGFQFATMFIEGFDKLPLSSKYVHLASLAVIALRTVVLMTPAAYHRIVEGGADTERFHQVASGFVLAAMVPLALGIAGDFYVVVRKVTESLPIAIVSGVVVLASFYGLRFGYTAMKRGSVDKRGNKTGAA